MNQSTTTTRFFFASDRKYSCMLCELLLNFSSFRLDVSVTGNILSENKGNYLHLWSRDTDRNIFCVRCSFFRRIQLECHCKIKQVCSSWIIRLYRSLFKKTTWTSTRSRRKVRHRGLHLIADGVNRHALSCVHCRWREDAAETNKQGSRLYRDRGYHRVGDETRPVLVYAASAWDDVDHLAMRFYSRRNARNDKLSIVFGKVVYAR